MMICLFRPGMVKVTGFSKSVGKNKLQNIAALLMHLIPSFVLLASLIVAWKWEKVGGIILTIIGIILFIAVFELNYKQRHFSLAQSLINVSLLCLPFILAGILFILSHNRKKKELSGAK